MSFFSFLIIYNCTFILNLNYLKKRLIFMGVFSDTHKNLYLNIFSPYMINLFLLNNHKSFFFNSLFHRVVNNYYFTDIFTNNSRVLSICALKSYKNNFSVNNLYIF
jgi:hypothetical protein